MSFNDVFKSGFLENIAEFSVVDMLIGLAVSLVIGMFIFAIYKKTLTGIMYSEGFALTLVGLSLVTTLVIMAVTSNVVLSLGMVGALSIVRFRAAIKEPIEIVFLFRAIACGIVGHGKSNDPLRRELCGAFGRIAARAVLPPPCRLNINAAA